MMKRATLAMGLGLGMFFAGCGPAEETIPPTPNAKGEVGKGGEGVSEGPSMGKMAGPDGGGMAGPAPKLDAKAAEGAGVDGMPAGYPVGGPDKEKKGETPAPEKKDETPKTAEVTLSADEVATIKSMPEASDAEAALAQKICPVGEEEPGKFNHLGSMGKPIKQEANGKTVYLCCKGCVEDFKADPAKYLAKVGK